MRARDRTAGFTLLEVLLAMAVMVMMLAIVYPSLRAMYGQQRVTAGADSFRAGLANARAQAVQDGLPYRIALVPGQGNFRVAPDFPAYWNTAGGDAGDGGNDNVVYILEDFLPDGVVFSDSGQAEVPEDGGTYQDPMAVQLAAYRPFAVFLPDGTARLADPYRDRMVVCSRGGTPMWVILRSLTGAVTVTRYEEEAP